MTHDRNQFLWEAAKAQFRNGGHVIITLNGKPEVMSEDLIRRVESGRYARDHFEPKYDYFAKGKPYRAGGEDEDSAFARRKSWSEATGARRDAKARGTVSAAAEAFMRQYRSDWNDRHAAFDPDHMMIGGVDIMPAIAAAIEAAGQARADAQQRKAGNVETIDL